MNDEVAANLLVQIVGDSDLLGKSFSPIAATDGAGIAAWDQLCDELKHRNRYFIDGGLDLDRLSELLTYLEADDLPKAWFRARIQSGEDPIPLDQMGAPPKRLAAHGRANPAGIPYLYLSSLPDGAAAEVRPHTGEVASVAEFSLPGRLKAIDLRDPKGLVSPFLLGDRDAVAQLRSDIPLLDRLGDELTRPVLPTGAAIDYVPTQYLCEFIKKCGYGGVVFRSSVSNAINLALFSPENATPTSLTRYSISRVSVEVEKLPTE